MRLLDPKAVLLMTPHVSVAVLFGFGFSRLQFGRKSAPLTARVVVHERVTDGLLNPNVRLAPGIRIDGFAPEARLLTLAPCRYLPTLTLTAVLPLPKTSYAAPMRGVMSL